MYQVKVFKKVNSVLGVLKGDFTILELEKYFKDLSEAIENQLDKDFIYMLDISEFYTGGIDGSDSVDRKMGEIRYDLEKIGMKELFLIGGSMKTFLAIKKDGEKQNYISEVMYYSNLEEVIDYLSKRS